jgi:hypothetical protein
MIIQRSSAALTEISSVESVRGNGTISIAGLGPESGLAGRPLPLP